MRFATAVVAVALVAIASATVATTGGNALPRTAEDIELAFQRFIKAHERDYATTEEYLMRLRVFSRFLAKAETMQRLNPHATFGITRFADWTEEEIDRSRNKRITQNAHRGEPKSELSQAQRDMTPGSIDWRSRGAVTSVKDQYQCGDCWAFSAIGNIEGQWAIAGNPLVSLSPQEVTACDTLAWKCQGGEPHLAFEWLTSTTNGYVCSESEYPFASKGGHSPPCDKAKEKAGKTAKIAGYVKIPTHEGDIKYHVANHGPVSVVVNATAWYSYKGGILSNCQTPSPSGTDHCVLIVGYDSEHSPPYWIVKNQWGTSWGEDGYIRVEMGINACQINSLPTSSYVGSEGKLKTHADTKVRNL